MKTQRKINTVLASLYPIIISVLGFAAVSVADQHNLNTGKGLADLGLSREAILHQSLKSDSTNLIK